MIETRPGAEFTAEALGFPAGLTVTFGVRLQPEGTLVIAQTSDDVVEFPQGGGLSNYQATRTMPEGADPTGTVVDGAAISYETAWGGLTVAEPEQIVVAETFSDYVPTIEDVAALIRARTTTKRAKPDPDGYAEGEQIGTFNADTRPTGTQVQTLIDQAVADVGMRIGVVIPEHLNQAARHVVSLRAAQLVELGYFPEQTETTGQSPYQTLRLSYEEALGKLVTAVQLRSLFSETLEDDA